MALGDILRSPENQLLQVFSQKRQMNTIVLRGPSWVDTLEILASDPEYTLVCSPTRTWVYYPFKPGIRFKVDQLWVGVPQLKQELLPMTQYVLALNDAGIWLDPSLPLQKGHILLVTDSKKSCAIRIRDMLSLEGRLKAKTQVPEKPSAYDWLDQ